MVKMVVSNRGLDAGPGRRAKVRSRLDAPFGADAKNLQIVESKRHNRL
jgi:hypothetical protein